MKGPRITIAGAGSIGCYVGGILAAAGHDVRFLARDRVVDATSKSGLHVTDYAGNTANIVQPRMFADPHGALGKAEIVMVCVKSGDTMQMAREVARHAPKALVLSLQNGVENAHLLRGALPQADVRATVVPFNVVSAGPAKYHRATSGNILIEAGSLPDLDTSTLAWEQVGNVEAVQWGKLLINLNNAINALSDLPLLTQLQDRAWRRLMADQMSEALAILRAAGIKPAKTTAVTPALIPHILRLPTPLFRRIAAQMLTIDAHARSSMWEDLSKRRTTEIDALQGAIISLGERYDRPAPLNAKMHQLIRDAETKGDGPPGLTTQAIRT